MSKTCMRRLRKELAELTSQKIDGINFDSDKISVNLMKWKIGVVGAPATLYENEKFELEFTFSSNYPFDSPQVIFVGDNIPVHPHIYSNGHICLSILTEDWTPAMTISSVCISIISMLSSCKLKERPPDNSFYVRKAGKNPKNTRWWYHDDQV